MGCRRTSPRRAPPRPASPYDFDHRYGRIRTVVNAPGGRLWFTTTNRDGRGTPRTGDDRIVSFRP